MDYKKKYENALERCKKAFNFNNLAYSHEEIRERLECVFPELKESEDERIRKSLIKSFTNQHPANFPTVDGFTREQILSWLEKQGEQKPAYKVEPKFKVGDWINKDGAIWRIEGVNGKEYILGGRPDVVIQEPIHIIDSEFRLWTIQDAKDGDIIVNDFVGGTCVAIYKSFTNDGTNIYCHLVNNDFCPKHGTSNAKWHPSTKEQRDLLFQKMEEAGYEWDDEKKELKMAESVQPELPNGEDYGIDSLYHAERILEKTLGEVEGYQSDDGILEHKCAIEAVKRLYKQKPAWSEEDEEMVNNIVDYMRPMPIFFESTIGESGKKYTQKFIEGAIVWLKSLKERVQPQPKQEWSEEDKMLLEKIISDYTAASKSFCGHQGKLDWLKSLKERME